MKFKGDQLSTTSKDGAGSTSEGIKFEPAFLAQHEEALLAAEYVQRSRFNNGPILRGG